MNTPRLGASCLVIDGPHKDELGFVSDLFGQGANAIERVEVTFYRQRHGHAPRKWLNPLVIAPAPHPGADPTINTEQVPL